MMNVSESSEKKRPLVVICGPTASGKTDFALEISDHLDIEVISADSRQVYRGMNIGTAKPTLEELSRLRHHLIDIVAPDEEFTAADFSDQGYCHAIDILDRGRFPVVVGGTGLYIRALTDGLMKTPGPDEAFRMELRALEQQQGEGSLHRLLQERDPALAVNVHPRNQVRIIRALEVIALTGRRFSELQSAHGFGDHPFSTLKIGLFPGRDELVRRIDRRVERMLEDGLIDEVRQLLDKGYSPGLKALLTIGYREIVQYIQGGLSLDEATMRIQRETRRYAKRQLTWFRKDPSIIWVDSCQESARLHSLIEQFYSSRRSGYGQDPIQYPGSVP